MRFPRFGFGVLRGAIFLCLVVFGLAACTARLDDPKPEITPAATLRAQSSENAVRVGVLAIRSAVTAQAQYGPILTYLEGTLGRPFTFVPLGQEDQFTKVEQGNVDFIFNNPLAAVQIRRLYGTRFLATLSYVETGPHFGGLIIVREDSGIATLDDLQGKRGACVNFETAAAGCIFQVYHLKQHGINPFTDFGIFTEIASQDNIVLSVLNGTIDVGFIRTGQLEQMVLEGAILNLDEIRILDRATDNYFYPHTTTLYPEWPFAALAHTDPSLADAVRQALIAIPADHPAMEQIKAVGFVPTTDYTSLDMLIETFHLRSWDVGP